MSLLNKLKEKFGQTEPLQERLAQATNKSNDVYFGLKPNASKPFAIGKTSNTTPTPESSVPDTIPSFRRGRVVGVPSTKPTKVNDSVITNVLSGEGLNSTPSQLAAAFEREGAVGPGQHRQIFFDEWNPIFNEEFGRDYDRENLEDVKVVTRLALEKYTKRFGSLEGALVAYNKGASVAQEYLDDPNYTFDDDPYVKGFKERMKK